MIAFLRGNLIAMTGSSAIIDVHGVGYLVQCSARTLEAMGQVGNEVSVLVITSVREDAITLYGFSDNEEKDIFQILVSLQGVGPKLAQTILSWFSSEELQVAITKEDKVAICKVPGVGPKLALRIVTELQGKISTTAHINTTTTVSNVDVEVRQALMALGYSAKEVSITMEELKKMPNKPSDTANLIRTCLKIIIGAK
jgi:Holliday junction DNA helicase RuvA